MRLALEAPEKFAGVGVVSGLLCTEYTTVVPTEQVKIVFIQGTQDPVVPIEGMHYDFDGDGELIGCRASNELINITMRLLKEGYTENDIAKIWGGNLLRVMNKAQSAPDNSL